MPGESMDYRDRIVRSPAICGGEPVVRGTHVPLRSVLATLAEGEGIEHILKDFPTLAEVDVRAAIAFAAASALEDMPRAGLPPGARRSGLGSPWTEIA
jgi:uncharacterized protein (DUF433 family)